MEEGESESEDELSEWAEERHSIAIIEIEYSLNELHLWTESQEVGRQGKEDKVGMRSEIW